MANFTGSEINNGAYVQSALTEPTGIDIGSSSGPSTPPVSILQRMYDTGVAGWVYYSLTTLTTTPLVSETSPNHTNNLVASTHEVY